MLNKLLAAFLQIPGLAVIILAAIFGFGIMKYRSMPVDAFPDVSPVLVQIFAEAHGMAPEEVERLITYPLEAAMNGLPKVTEIKSTSAFGMAVLYVYFEDGVDMFFARQLVAERLAAASAELPSLEKPPALGPISTGLGQVFIYYLTADPAKVDTGGLDMLTWLRQWNDWTVKYQLQTVPGVADVLSMGGHVLQYQINLDPNRMRQYGLRLDEVVEAVTANNRNVGGQFLVLGAEEHLVRGIGLAGSLDDLRAIPVKTDRGVPVRLEAIAELSPGREIRRGVVTRNGEGEVVSGIVMKLYGENTSAVIERLYEKVDSIRAMLPAGVSLVPYYEQAELVAKATDTVKQALWQGALLVIVVLALFSGTWRTAFIVSLALPVCALTAVLGMGWYGISASLMSLGGIAVAIGMLGDGSIIMVENIYRRLGEVAGRNGSRKDVILTAAAEVAKPILCSIAIIILVFLPLFTLTGYEGKMFKPMAFTIAFALLGSLLMALFVVPSLALGLLKLQAQRSNAVLNFCVRLYRPLLNLACRGRYAVVLLALALLGGSLFGLRKIGKEFIPTLEEGSMLIGVSMAPSQALSDGAAMILRLEKMLMAFPEVEETVSRIGRPEAGSHPHPVNTAEIQLTLKPRSEWRYASKAELETAIRTVIGAVPGAQYHFTQPIQNAFDELLSGVKTQLAIKLFGEDLTVLRQKAGEIVTAIASVPGLVDLSSEQNFGQPQVLVVARRDACARFGVPVDELMEMVELAIGGEVIGTLYQNARRIGIQLRYQEPYRDTPEAIGALPMSTAAGGLVHLRDVAEIRSVVGPLQINREKNQRRWVVQGNIRGRAISRVVDDIRQRISERVVLPPGYAVEFGGQFENQQRAMGRLMLIIPVVIVGIFVMLWMGLGQLRHALVIMLNVPLALVGGVFGLIVTGQYLSVPAAVGFIALFGIAVQNGMVLVTTFNDICNRGVPVAEAIRQGAEIRLRPVLMTALTTIIGLLPLLLSRGIGSEVQRPLAVVVVFGLASSTLLTLFVLPVVYSMVEKHFRPPAPAS